MGTPDDEPDEPDIHDLPMSFFGGGDRKLGLPSAMDVLMDRSRSSSISSNTGKSMTLVTVDEGASSAKGNLQEQPLEESQVLHELNRLAATFKDKNDEFWSTPKPKLKKKGVEDEQNEQSERRRMLINRHRCRRNSDEMRGAQTLKNMETSLAQEYGHRLAEQSNPPVSVEDSESDFGGDDNSPMSSKVISPRASFLRRANRSKSVPHLDIMSFTSKRTSAGKLSPMNAPLPEVEESPRMKPRNFRRASTFINVVPVNRPRAATEDLPKRHSSDLKRRSFKRASTLFGRTPLEQLGGDSEDSAKGYSTDDPIGTSSVPLQHGRTERRKKTNNFKKSIIRYMSEGDHSPIDRSPNDKSPNIKFMTDLSPSMQLSFNNS